MRYFNFSVEVMKKPDFTSAKNLQIGTWFRLTCYCCEQENGGIIRNCRSWTDRQWLIACGLEKEEVSGDTTLWRWDKVGGLIVNHYPEEQERNIQFKRKAGKDAAKRRWGKKLNGSPNGSPIGSPNAKGNSKGREYTISVDRCPELEPDSE